MNKKYLFFAIPIIMIAIAVIVLFRNQGAVVLEFDNTTGASVDIFKNGANNENPVVTVTEPGVVKLKKGNYISRVSGDQYQPTQQEFNVSNSVETIKIIVSYNNKQLSSIKMREQKNIISATIKSIRSYNSNTDTLSHLRLYRLGEWASVIISTNRTAADYYHILLKKESGTWHVITKPEIVISHIDYQSIPVDILSTVNSDQSADTKEDIITGDNDYTGDGAPPEELGL